MRVRPPAPVPPNLWSWCGMFLPQELVARFLFFSSRQERPVGELGGKNKAGTAQPTFQSREGYLPSFHCWDYLEGQHFFKTFFS